MAAWWINTSMGLDSGIDQEPPVDVQFNDGTWHTEVAWPPPGTRDLKLFTHPNSGGGGALDLLPPADASQSIFDDHPSELLDAVEPQRGGPRRGSPSGPRP